ncbi:DUF2937 family protein [Bradyrhizobium sp. 35]|nr:DUF2937 family protein [Bradyrhizobium sp. 35]
MLFAQIPELLQQYRQQLRGAADELTVIVRNFDEDSRRSGYDRSGALGDGEEPRTTGARPGAANDGICSKAGPAERAAIGFGGWRHACGHPGVAVDYDKPIMAQAWSAYAPALPTTLTGIVFAIIGWCLPYAGFLVLGAVAGSRLRAAFLYLNSCSRSSPRAAAG